MRCPPRSSYTKEYCMKEYVYKGQVYTLTKLSQATTISYAHLKKMLAPFSETAGRIEVTEVIDDYLKKRDNKNKREYVYKGQVYTFTKLSQVTTISFKYLKKMLAQFSETEGRIDVTQLLDDYLKKRHKEYVYKGQVYTSIIKLAQATTINFESLRKMLAQFSETEGRIDVTQLIDDYLKKRDKEYVYKGQVYTLTKLSQVTTISFNYLKKMLAQFSETAGRIDVTQLLDDYLKKRHKEYVYKGQVYPSINSLSHATTVSHHYLRKMLAQFSETAGRIEVDQLIDAYLKKRHNSKKYVYKGQVYTSIKKLAQATTINFKSLRKMLAQFSETAGRIEVTQLIDDYLKNRDNPREYVYKGQVYPSINSLAYATTISHHYLRKMLAQFSETAGRIEVTQLIDDYLKKRDKEYVYKGQIYTELAQLAQAVNIRFYTLEKMLAQFSEIEGRIDVTQLIDAYLKKRDNPREYVYKGQVYTSIDYSARSAHALKRVQRMLITI